MTHVGYMIAPNKSECPRVGEDRGRDQESVGSLMDPDFTTREVLARVDAVRRLCEEILADHSYATSTIIHLAAEMLGRAADYADGFPVGDA